MRFVEDFTKDEYIDWLMAYKDYSHKDAVKMADIMYEKEGQNDSKDEKMEVKK